MNRTKVPLGYLSDSRIANCIDSTKTIAISVMNNPLDSISKVSKINGLFLPLIVFYYHEVNLFLELGQQSLEQRFDQFFREKLEAEVMRRGCYTVGTNDNVDYMLEITFENSHTTTKYSSKSSFFYVVVAVLHTSSTRASPSSTLMKAKAVLKKDGNVVYEKEYELRQEQDFLRAGVKSRGMLVKVQSNMAENLSLTSKGCIERIVKDFNTYIRSNP